MSPLQDYGYWYKDYFLTPDMVTAYFAIDKATVNNGCMKVHERPPTSLTVLQSGTTQVCLCSVLLSCSQVQLYSV